MFELILLMGLALLLYLLNIRSCPLFYLFHIPCPACGMTRSFLYLIQGNFTMCFKINPLSIFIFAFIILYILFSIFKKRKILDYFLKKYKLLTIILCSILIILIELYNIQNPLLYL